MGELPRSIIEERIIERAKPLDLSFKKLIALDLGLVSELAPRLNRIGKAPPRSESGRYLTRAILLNNNQLLNIRNVESFVSTFLEQPAKLGWLDFSCNNITELDECIGIFPNLRILYFHGNKINEVDEVYKLRGLSNLRSLTFYGNPMANDGKLYRISVVTYLPQLNKLDLCGITNADKQQMKPSDIVKRLYAAENKD